MPEPSTIRVVLVEDEPLLRDAIKNACRAAEKRAAQERQERPAIGQPRRIEYRLLGVLIANAGKVVTHRQILTAVWGPAHAQDLQYLRVFIGQLRQKLREAFSDPDVIETEAGIGYRLALPES